MDRPEDNFAASASASSPASAESGSSQSVGLGPVAAKGPKRFGAMPDLSKIPASARERLAQFAQDVPEWGASAVDARALQISEDPNEVSLDLSPLGAPTPHVPAAEPVPPVSHSSSEPEEPHELQESQAPVSEFSGEEYLEDDDDFEEFESPASALDVDSPSSSIFDAGSTSLTRSPDEVTNLGGPGLEGAVSSPSVNTQPLSDDPPATSVVAQEAGVPDVACQQAAPVVSATAPEPAPAPVPEREPDTASVQAAAPTEMWADGIPLPEEPEPFWDDYEPHLPEQTNQRPKAIPAQHTSPDAVTRPIPDRGSAQPPRPAVSENELRATAERHLQRLVGSAQAQLREDQWTAIKALVMDRSRALVVQRTGWGKSAVYFVATSLLRAQGDGPTIIISPLLALMRDQIAAAERAGIRAATINSANITEWEQIHALIGRGEIDVLLCSPERLNNPQFRDEVLPRLAQDAGLVVIDEAHCISDWGHDFRPDYRRIRTLLEELRPGIPVLATTATANERVSTDIAEQLALSAHGSLENVTVLRGELDRESLHLAVVQLPDTAHRIAWITDALKNLSGSGIVYCMTVSAAHEVTEQLKASGLNVAAYTGRTDPDERAQLEVQLKNNEVKALIATSALGMGFDKPDLTFVIHLGAPNSPIAYYQQVGRAGRGVAQASAILLPGKEDREIWEYFGSLAFPSEPQVREVIGLLDAAQANGMGPISVPQLESKVELKRSRLEMMLKVLDVDGAVKRVKSGWISTGQPWTYDTQRYRRVESARLAEQNAMLAYAASTQCRIGFLRNCLDDPALPAQFSCGRCDNCGGISLPSAVSQESLATTTASIAAPGIEVPARKMWPTNMAALGIDVKGRISAEEQSADGKAIARIDGLSWSNDLRELFSPQTPDGPTPVRLRTAAVQVLDNWTTIPECEGVVSVRSLARPHMIDHLARGLAQYLKLPYIGTVGPTNDMPAARHDLNSAMRLAGVARRLQLELSSQALSGLPGRTVLLIDDYTDSGWTIAVASRLLRKAGAANVVPFVLAQN